MYKCSIIFLYLCCYFVIGSCRTLSCFVNPGLLHTEQANINIVHIKSSGEADDIHYIFSSYKIPSLIVARTTKNTTLTIDSKKLASFEDDSIVFSHKPLDSTGLTFTELWEFHYNDSLQAINNISSVTRLNLKNFSWNDVNESFICSETYASSSLTSYNDELLFSKNGTFKIQFSVSALQELSFTHPHLMFTGNSTLLRIIMDNFFSNYSRSRYALRILIFSQSPDKCEFDRWQTIIRRTINDEFSPGSFSDVELLSPCSNDKTKAGSFIAWRPVAYTGSVPIVANTSDATMMSDPVPFKNNVTQSIAELYFSDKYQIFAFNITFGTEGDGFYIKTKYAEWSLMTGTGTMVVLPLSSSVIIFTSVGLGLLGLFLLSGLIFLLYNRLKERDDDLLLN